VLLLLLLPLLFSCCAECWQLRQTLANRYHGKLGMCKHYPSARGVGRRGSGNANDCFVKMVATTCEVSSRAAGGGTPPRTHGRSIQKAYRITQNMPNF
jgi:hypothetical protein